MTAPHRGVSPRLPGTDEAGAVFFLSILVAVFLASCASQGERLFESEGCRGCHTVHGAGGRIGPDLTAVTGRRSDDWIRAQIKNSNEHNPRSRMPSFSHLSELEIRSLIAFLNE